MMFLNPTAALLVFGGTALSTWIAFPPGDTMKGLAGLRLIVRRPKKKLVTKAAQLLELANLARMAGFLSLEDTAHSMQDPFLKKGLRLVAENIGGREIRAVLMGELDAAARRHARVWTVWEFVASAAPAWGFIGTLFCCMLSWPQGVDPSALAATLYGTVLSVLIAGPAANKLRILHDAETFEKRISLEAVLSIQAGEPISLMEERLKSFLGHGVR